MLLVIDVRLPETRSAGVASEFAVGLQTDLAAERRHDFALIRAVAGEEGALELSLNEELSVERERRRVEGSAGDGGVDLPVHVYQHHEADADILK